MLYKRETATDKRQITILNGKSRKTASLHLPKGHVDNVNVLANIKRKKAIKPTITNLHVSPPLQPGQLDEPTKNLETYPAYIGLRTSHSTQTVDQLIS